jgi:hypothetical protein
MIGVNYRVWAMVHVLQAAYQTKLYIMTATYHTMASCTLSRATTVYDCSNNTSTTSSSRTSSSTPRDVI